MTPIPHIKKSDITRWTDETHFQRGLEFSKFTNQGTWNGQIAKIRARYKKLPALQAGLNELKL